MQLNKKLTLAIFALLIVGIAISGCTKKKPPVKTPAELILECKSLPAQLTKENCLLSLASTGIESCSEIATAGKKDSCFQALATAKNDQNYCGKISSQTVKDSCNIIFTANPQSKEACLKMENAENRDNCLNQAATAAKDIETCKLVSSIDIKENCISIVAQQTGNLQACEEITNETARQSCIAETTKQAKSPETCNVLKGTAEKDDCILNAASSSQNEEYCRSITNSEKKDSCHYQIARALKKIDSCQQIENAQSKNDCINEIALAQETSENCGKIASSVKRDECFNSFAVKEKNTDLCYSISSQQPRDACINQIANLLENESECPKISQPAEKNNCYYNLAVIKTTASICDSISSDQNLSDKCYNDTAINDANTCTKIITQELKDDCILNASKNTKTTDYCKFINDKIKKINCHSQTAIAQIDEKYCSEILLEAKNSTEKLETYGPGNDSCVSEIAGLKTDEKICDILYFASNKPKCFGNVAAARSNDSLCATLPVGAVYQLGAFDKPDDCYYTFAKKTSKQEACSKINGSSFKNKCDCLFNSASCSATGNSTVTITIKSFDGNLLPNISAVLFKNPADYYSSFFTSETGIAVFDPVIEGNYTLLISDNSGQFAPQEMQLKLMLGIPISQEITLNEACNPSQIKNNYQGTDCCYLGNMVTNNYPLSADNSPDKAKILCSAKSIYSCGSTACTAPTCVLAANAQIVESYTCNSATGWTLNG
ncbi:MAG: hypothetical protein Q7R70_03440 [Candidatus Diapherotrites archaeon]|nr:hypothetical protein [Candidatus Diapherotrites archaeon]